jgi:demethylmenaquinone methyltransferase/2-methoxy-6-polyprenyl-1,4-benzoquinol methylase
MEARELFAPIGPTYERYATLLSYGQDPRWRRFLVSRIEAGPGDRVLDVATGTGMVARELVRQKGCSVVGVDQSPEMLLEARARSNGDIELVEASAETLPFADGEFDALTFTTSCGTWLTPLPRSPGAGACRPLGRDCGSLGSGLPLVAWRPLWQPHVRAVLPGAGLAIDSGWREVGAFLGPSIRGYWAAWPLERQLSAWRDAGLEDVEARSLSVGGGIVTWGRKR